MLAANAFGEIPVLSDSIQVVLCMNGSYTIPRYKAANNGDTLYVFGRPDNARSCGQWVYSIDSGTTWGTIVGGTSDPPAGWIDDDGYIDEHAGICYGQGIHWAGPDGADIVYRYIYSPATARTDRGTLRTVTSGTSGMIRPSIIASDTQHVWVIVRDSSKTGYNPYWFFSDDMFATTPDSGLFLASSTNYQTRLGSMLDSLNNPIIVYPYWPGDATNGYYYRHWNGSSFIGEADSAIVQNSAITYSYRHYGINYFSKRIHLVFAGPNARIYHYYQNGSGTWLCDTASVCSSQPTYPQLCARDTELWIFWALSTGTIVGKSWTAANKWDADSIIITADGETSEIPMTIYNADGLSYIPVWYNVGGGGTSSYMSFRRLQYTEDSPADITHSLTAVSKTSSSVTVEDIYSGGVGVDTVWLFYDDDATIAGADYTYDASSLGTPDTVMASGLSASTEYHFWMVISEDNGRDTSSSITETTSATATIINRVRIRK